MVHVHHNFSGLVTSITAFAFTKAKIVTTIHNNYNFFSQRQKIIFFLTYVLSDLIICNSCNTKNVIEKLRKRFFPKTQTRVIYNGIDIQKRINAQPCASSSSKTPRCFTIGMVGRLVAQKDHKTVIKAFAKFNKKFSNSKLILIGDGPLRQELAQLADKLGIKEKVVFCGLVARTKVYETLNYFDLFVVSSKWEGFCNAMVEAMVAGVPIIASRVEPLPEVLGPCNGVFFDTGHTDDLYEKMIYCYANRDDVKRRAARAFDFACERYSLKVSTQKYEEVYSKLCEAKKGV